MKRREFIAGLAGAAVTWPMMARAQQPPGKTWRIGMLETTSEALNAANIAAFRESLRAMGYIDHKNYVVEYRSADGRSERFVPLAAELLQLGVDIIVARGTPATAAARNATNEVPIVMTSTADPYAVVASIARPGGNITGFSSLISDLSSKRLELLKDLLPRFDRVAIFNDGRNPTLPNTMRAVQEAAQAFKIEVKQYDVRKTEDFPLAFAAARRDQADAISMGTETTTQANRKLIVELAGEHRIPVIYSSREFVDAGGLIALGVSYQDLYRRAAIYVDKIFKGTKPGELPVEQPTKFELVINLKTAKALGLTVPPTLIARADEVIE